MIPDANRRFGLVERIDDRHIKIVPSGSADFALMGFAPLGLLEKEAPETDVLELSSEPPPFLATLQASGIPVVAQLAEDSTTVRHVVVPQQCRVLAITENPGENSFFVEESPSAMRIRTDTPEGIALAERIGRARDQKTDLSIFLDPQTRQVIEALDGPIQLCSEYRALDVYGEKGTPRFVEIVESIAQACRHLAIDEDAACDLFDFLAGQKDIPFHTPCDCCHSRAHAMAKLILSKNVIPGKIWNYGALRVFAGAGTFSWRVHVAPTIMVRTERGIEERVLDPSLFQKPVPASDWQAVQNDATSTLERSSYVFYVRGQGNTDLRLDPNFCMMEFDFSRCRTQCAPAD